MEGPDGKKLLSMQELEELRAEYVKSKLDENVISHVGECQRPFFKKPDSEDMFNIKGNPGE